MDKHTRVEYLAALEQAIEKERQMAGNPTRTNIRAVVEKVHSTPQMGVVSAFTFGQSYELHLSMLTALKIPFELVSPQEWQKFLKIKRPKHLKKYNERKLFLRNLAIEKFPDMLEGRTKKYQDAVCDALLIMEYGRLKGVSKFVEE